MKPIHKATAKPKGKVFLHTVDDRTLKLPANTVTCLKFTFAQVETAQVRVRKMQWG